MGINYIVMAWVLWYLSAPKWVWVLLFISLLIDRTVEKLTIIERKNE